MKDPATISFQSQTLRRFILASYWIVIILALPLWWNTTSIQRLSLPSSHVLAQADRDLGFAVQIALDSSYDSNILSNLQQYFKSRRSRRWKGLDITVDTTTNAPNTYSIVPGKTFVIRDRILQVPRENLSSITNTLSSLLVPHSIFTNPHVMQYAPRYRLAFTLMNEDAADGPSIINWNVKAGISRFIQPIISAVAPLHNFTIESQVQYQGPLAFQPQHGDQGGYGLTQEDLTIFINSAEWTLSSSISEDPVIHFLLYVPAASRRPLVLLDQEGASSSSKAFILPQWGSVVIHNPSSTLSSHSQLPSSDLDLVFSTFAYHLQMLLGVPRVPPGVKVEGIEGLLSSWQLDALLRCRALESAREAKDTLRSTVRLVGQIEDMPVDDHVRGDVQGALDALEMMHSVSASSLTATLKHSARAMTQASRAFFHPGMLAMLYFPAEHKYAVYTPLFASAMVPLFAALVRETLAWRRQRRGEV